MSNIQYPISTSTIYVHVHVRGQWRNDATHACMGSSTFIMRAAVAVNAPFLRLTDLAKVIDLYDSVKRFTVTFFQSGGSRPWSDCETRDAFVEGGSIKKEDFKEKQLSWCEHFIFNIIADSLNEKKERKRADCPPRHIHIHREEDYLQNLTALMCHVLIRRYWLIIRIGLMKSARTSSTAFAEAALFSGLFVIETLVSTRS